MRNPIADPYVFHRRLLAKEPVVIEMNEYHAGWYKGTMVKGGPWVGIEVRLIQEVDEETGELIAEPIFEVWRDGKKISLERHWQYFVKHPISEDDYRYMVAKAEWAKKNDPGSPEANPRQKIDPSKIGRLF
jgi:hypothetical protein